MVIAIAIRQNNFVLPKNFDSHGKGDDILFAIKINCCYARILLMFGPRKRKLLLMNYVLRWYDVIDPFQSRHLAKYQTSLKNPK